MEMRPECVPCLIRRVVFEAEEAGGGKAVETTAAATRILGGLFAPGACSASVATKVHREVYRLLGDADPYRELKLRSNDVVLSLYREAEEFVESSDDRLRAALLCAVVGNVLDFGIGTEFDSPEVLEGRFRELLAEGLGHDDTPALREMLEHAEHVVYLADNCGEIVLDRLALTEIARPGTRITLVVKGEPILTDVTMADIEGLGIEEIVDEIAESPGFAVGIGVDALNGDFGDWLRKADLVVAKGMANYEALSETDIGPVVYLLRTKCSPVAESIGLRKGMNVVKLLPHGGVR
ncbi:MAG: DUF89 family protein [Methanobacteriota archaeon]|nr:MAG: DUF89 family protein [Euryarchaeota archaeon]